MGTANHILAGNTDPTNNVSQGVFLGTVSLGAVFTNGTVTSNVQIGSADKVWKATGNGAINANLFNGSPLGTGLTSQLVNGSGHVSGAAIFKKQ